MSEAEKYVRVDEHGVMRVGKTRVMLDSVIAGFEQGDSAESIHQQYPSLGLEDVYGAIAYYLSHVEEVKEYLVRQGKVWDHWRAKTGNRPSSVMERLRSLAVRQVGPEGAGVSED